ncbi:Autophagy-related protein 1010 [Venturia nashicola]|uniref:Autophagy-related protein 101 n=1 Tax=Venturia nashicola TaxID=86259 RepID=A0A4Z1P4Y4_9PEZI|nr:autophagy-related protein [Venturia nashicola]TLD23429.1 Autophagy-related protein 1010 [Venturia nashicola]
MEPRRPKVPEYTLEVFADPTCVKDIVKAILHTIFFHRYFIPIVPLTRDLLDQTLPAIDDVDLETLIDQRATSLVRAIERPTDMPTVHPGGRSGYNSGSNAKSGRAQIAVQFFEKKRKKTFFFGKGDEEICWEQWTLDITCATPRTESDRIKVRAAMEKSLQKTCLKIINIVNRDKDHIPPITGLDNPFPYQIVVNPRSENWGARMGIF